MLLTLGTETLPPDGSMQLRTWDGWEFHFLSELDNRTELDPVRTTPQEHQAEGTFLRTVTGRVLASWQRGDQERSPLRYRVLFFIHSFESQNHLLRAARPPASNPDRRLCLAGSVPDYPSDPNPPRTPIALDHHSRWHGIVSELMESRFQREPLHLEPLVKSLFASPLVT